MYPCSDICTGILARISVKRDDHMTSAGIRVRIYVHVHISEHGYAGYPCKDMQVGILARTIPDWRKTSFDNSLSVLFVDNLYAGHPATIFRDDKYAIFYCILCGSNC